MPAKMAAANRLNRGAATSAHMLNLSHYTCLAMSQLGTLGYLVAMFENQLSESSRTTISILSPIFLWN